MAKAPKKKDWSLLAYIAGDNDLSDYALMDVTEMCKEGASEKVHVGIQIDTEGDFDGLIRYEITEPDFSGKSYRTVIDRLPEMDSGSSACLASFLQFGLQRYPSKQKMVVVWSHGSGFKTIRRDAGFDYSSGNSMDMNEIVTAFTKSGINSKNKISILGFDACLMAMLEVAHHFSDHAELLVGSQQTEPGNGWPYDKVLYHLKNKKTKLGVAEGIVDEYIAYYKRTNQSDVTQAAIVLSNTEKAIKAVSDLGNYLKKNLDGIKTKINQVRIKSQNFEYADYIDIIDFMNQLSSVIGDPQLDKYCNAVTTATKNCIHHSGNYGHAVRNSNGLSMWFPGRKELYIDYRAKYMKLKCNQKSYGWVEFLDAYYGD